MELESRLIRERMIRKAIHVEMIILYCLLVSTILTLFVIPSLIAVVDDLKRSRKKATAMGLGIRTNGKLGVVV